MRSRRGLNLTSPAEHHKRALEHIPGVSFYVDQKANRVGVLTTEEISAAAVIARRFEPEQAAVNRYEALYEEFPKLMKSQAGMFRRLQRR